MGQAPTLATYGRQALSKQRRLAAGGHATLKLTGSSCRAQRVGRKKQFAT
jgi:hypothetical protein